MLLTPSEYNRPQTKIIPPSIAWHYLENLRNTHQTYASCHFIVGLKGEILQLIPEDEKSFCTNWANNYTISIECCHPDKTGKFTNETYCSMVWLGAYLMRKYKIKERSYDTRISR